MRWNNDADLLGDKQQFILCSQPPISHAITHRATNNNLSYINNKLVVSAFHNYPHEGFLMSSLQGKRSAKFVQLKTIWLRLERDRGHGEKKD